MSDLVVLVCGGREYDDFEKVRGVLDALMPACIVHGGSKGADELADRWAKARGINVIPFPADWRTFKKAAGPIRNTAMLEAAMPDLVVAFPGGKGTDDLVAKAIDADIPVWEVAK